MASSPCVVEAKPGVGDRVTSAVQCDLLAQSAYETKSLHFFPERHEPILQPSASHSQATDALSALAVAKELTCDVEEKLLWELIDKAHIRIERCFGGRARAPERLPSDSFGRLHIHDAYVRVRVRVRVCRRCLCRVLCVGGFAVCSRWRAVNMKQKTSCINVHSLIVFISTSRSCAGLPPPPPRPRLSLRGYRTAPSPGALRCGQMFQGERLRLTHNIGNPCTHGTHSFTRAK